MVENRKTVEQIAREMVNGLGADAVPVLKKLAAQATAVGDQHGAAAWREIAVIAEGALSVLAVFLTQPRTEQRSFVFRQCRAMPYALGCP